MMLQGALMLGLVAACTTDDEPGVAGGKKGYATGKITDTAGNPMKGVEVVIDNTMFHASYSLGVTDANGNYEIQLPSVGTFMASAQIVKEYNGRRYEQDLNPDVFEPFSIDGAVRNFQWKLTGLRPEGEGYFGATVGINKALYSAIYDDENIEFTLTPVGNLIDGSKGKVLKVKPAQGYIEDIPLGRYEMSAYYNGEAGKMPLKLRDHFSDDAYESTLVIDFEPSTIWGRNSFYISYTE
ncbi:hypothetical protein GCM10010967_05500 [Dyadobacter beijingensis]|uniref:Carboxypeptidase regulatory-like domain-containing protein n=2 Tax=Dyadobacter beijingensis TaxID=365489 RepID=A0ABQ2HEF1_9BACT|nr:hypothetical protein GCM10010967_05500 [Dyadobacter beijingensis]